jgi:type II secretory pathway component GspD/PulD (secretin)
VNQNGQSNSVTLENVGLILGVTPRISPDGTVVMEIDAEKSSLGPEQDGVPVAVSVDGTVIRSPRIDTTTAQATVSAADGETIVLGGLITKSTSEFHRQVPWLGDIPVLGRLFRYDGTQSRRTELMIILTPRVIRTPEDNTRIRQTEMARMDWCAADIFEMHGDIGFSADAHPRVLDRNPSQVIYPDLDPSGQGIKPPTNKPMNDRQ